MTTIRTTCALCGDVELTVEDITLELSDSGDTYVFEHDGHVNRRPANARVASILIAAGVRYVKTVPAITEAEVEEWIAALATVRDLEELEMT